MARGRRMELLSWFRRLFRERSLPGETSVPVRVDFVGRVVSANTATSPITGLTASMMEIALMDWETVFVHGSRLGDEREVDRFTMLGSARYGTSLVIKDGERSLLIEDFSAIKVVPLSPRPLVLDVPPPKDLADAARKSAHMLSYREVRFREADSVRVVATVRTGEVRVEGGGYRDAVMRTLMPVQGERLELHELL
jgi:hypothetical protein